MFTTFWIAITCFVSIIFPNIKQVLSILGGLIAVQLSYTLPTYVKVTLSKNSWYQWDNLKAILFFGTLFILGMLSVVVTVIEIVTGENEMPRWK